MATRYGMAYDTLFRLARHSRDEVHLLPEHAEFIQRNGQLFAEVAISGGAAIAVHENLGHLQSTQPQYDFKEAKSALVLPTLDELVRKRPTLQCAYSVIRETLDSLGAEYIFLRGHPFEDRYYPSSSRRTSTDIDLLVRAEAIDAIISVFQDIGFALTETEEYRTAYHAYTGQIMFFNSSMGLVIDMNYSLRAAGNRGPISTDIAKLWERSERVSKWESALSPTDELFQCIDHAARSHCFGARLVKSCMDADAIMRSAVERIDFQNIMAQAKSVQSEMAFSYFSAIYNCRYRTEASSRRIPSPHHVDGGLELRLFENCCVLAHHGVRGVPNTYKSLAHLNIQKAAIIWTSDSPKRLVQLWRFPLFPAEDELVLHLEKIGGANGHFKRVRLLTMFFIFLGPGVFVGHLGFLLSVCLRYYQRVSRPLRPKATNTG